VIVVSDFCKLINPPPPGYKPNLRSNYLKVNTSQWQQGSKAQHSNKSFTRTVTAKRNGAGQLLVPLVNWSDRWSSFPDNSGIFCRMSYCSYAIGFLPFVVGIRVSVKSRDFVMWDFRFSRQRARKWLSFEMSEDGGSKHLWNIGQFLPDYMAIHSRRQPPSGIFPYATA
jgi:hypothetical protein